MKTSKIPTLAFALPFTLVLSVPLLAAGCGGDAPTPDDEPVLETAAEAAVESPGDGTEYEPAYPEDVSAEGLSDEDTAQQRSHTHADGTSHSHEEGDDHDEGGEGEHAHDGDEDHDH